MIYRGVSIALLPFWRFDAKGGELVLLGLVDLQGSGTSTCLPVVLFACLCLFSVNLFAIWVWLCKTMSCFTLRAWYILEFQNYIVDLMEFWIYLWSMFDGIWNHGII